ncbi:MAG: DUF2177 family protein [Usitatibacteraceae bacterium]
MKLTIDESGGAGAMIMVFLATLAAFVALDALWISLVALKVFQGAIGGIMRPVPLIVPAAIFYVIYIAGLIRLAVMPALRERSAKSAATNGAILGLTAYATFDLTNLTIIQGWTPKLAAVDMAWGTAVSAIAAVAGYLVGIRKRS